MSTILVSAQDLGFKRGGRQILNDINLDLKAGRIYTLIGPNGAGKSTLVKLLLGLVKPDSGRIKRPKGLRIGYMPQKLELDKNLPLSVQRFLAFACKDKTVIGETMKEMNIEHLATSQIFTLSGGELQRVLLARAMLRKPELLILDEPVQGVDVKGQSELYQLIASLRDRYQCGVLMVSHDLHLVMSATDEVICLNQHICCHGHPESVCQDPEYLRLFGLSDSDNIAVYTHHHDHHHDLQGNVIDSADNDNNSARHKAHQHGPQCRH
jgi:zinc transport system ATP-binding protein